MRTAAASLFGGIALFTFGLVGCAADVATDADDTEVASSEEEVKGVSNTGYFVITRRDTRKCVAPLCGGYYVRRVNDALTTCADGTKAKECYVQSITFGGVGLSDRETQDFLAAFEEGRAVVKARTYKSKWHGHVIGTLKANEAWLGATGSAAVGTFYRVADNGIRCIKAPCPTTSAYELNGKASQTLAAVHLDGTEIPADDDTLARAQTAIGTAEGILVTGDIAFPKCAAIAAGCGPFLNASEFFVRVTAREGKTCGSWSGLGCNPGQFCQWKSGDICGAADAPGTCGYRPQFCYELYQPVCGCDGKTYGNNCKAAAAGTSVVSEGACPSAD